jgi:hypothetical protein
LSQPGGLAATEGTRVTNAQGQQGPEAHPLAQHGPDKPLSVADGPNSVQQRMIDNPNMQRATKFTDRGVMETAIGETIDANQARIQAWLATNPPPGANLNPPITHAPGMGDLGAGFQRNPATGAIEPIPAGSLQSVLVVLKSNGAGGYIIQSAFPTP